MPVFLEAPNVLGATITKRTVSNVTPTKMAALNECVRNIDPTKIEVEIKKGVSENLFF
jgi:hypothetical protein